MLPRLSFLCLAIPAMILALPAAAQVEHDGGGWLNLTVQGSAGARGIWFVEAQPRLQDEGQRLDQLLLRGAIGVRVTDRLSLSQGYTHVVQTVPGARDLNEERAFQQIAWSVPRTGRLALSSRTRIEQRWRSDGKDMQVRLREMVRASHPIRGTGVRALASTELFWVMNGVDWRAGAGFDQLRTFIGVELPLHGKSTVEAGYLNQTIDRPGGAARMNHNIAVSLFWRL